MSRLKTFRRFLFSYLVVLLIPVILLTVLFSNVIIGTYGIQLIDSERLAAKQAGATLDMMSEQMAAYVAFTSNQSEFSSRTLKEFGKMFETREMLSKWMFASPAVSDIIFYNTNERYFYAYNARYSPDELCSWRIQDLHMDENSLLSVLNSDRKSLWLSGGEDGYIYYLNSIRLADKSRNWLMFRLEPKQLIHILGADQHGSNKYVGICTSEGNILYHTGMRLDQKTIELFLGREAQEGTETVENRRLVYVRSDNHHGLIFLSASPLDEVQKPLRKIWRLEFLALLAILILGSLICILMSRVNYQPIKKLENEMKQAHVLKKESPDLVENLRATFEMMAEDARKAESRRIAIAKESAVLKLLTGEYRSVQSFNEDVQVIGMYLPGKSWHIIMISGNGQDDESYYSAMVKTVRSSHPSLENAMYLELPDSESILFVVPGASNQEETECVSAAAKLMNSGVTVFIGAPCTDTAQLALSWSGLLQTRFSRNGEADNGEEIQDLISMMKAAYELRETERMKFAFRGIKEMIPTQTKEQRIEISYMLRNAVAALFPHEEGEIHRISEQVIHAILYADLPVSDAIGKYEDFFLAHMQSEETDLSPDALMIAYLQDHYHETGMTVQQFADAFGLSISNASHYFKNHVGMSISDYLEQLRMTEAKQLLVTTQKSASEIAITVGYAVPATFIRAFKKVTGLSTTDYRKQHTESH